MLFIEKLIKCYSTYSFGGAVNQNSIDGIIAKKEARTLFDKVQEEADENNVKLRREIIVNSRSNSRSKKVLI